MSTALHRILAAACAILIVAAGAPAAGQGLASPDPAAPGASAPVRSSSDAPRPRMPPMQPPVEAQAQRGVPLNAPLPPNPATSGQPVVFGSQIFSGRFGAVSFAGFNPNYQIAVGDRINVRMWGAFTLDTALTVDPQGNLFVPSVGPVKVLGVRNADLNAQLESQVKRVFKSNVGVYAALGAAQPVKIFVTGFVRAPGLYGGLSSDSVLYYLDQAGGIDPDRGSYLEVDVLRNGAPRARLNLYQFLLEGRIEQLQLQDGDTILARPRKYTVQVGGEVLNPYIFEIDSESVPASQILAAARPRAGATHLSIVRKVGLEQRSEYYAITDLQSVSIQNGDEVRVTSDKYPGTILVHIEGAQMGARTLVLPYGNRLKDALARLTPAPTARLDAVQLYRKSVALRQKEALESGLRNLETYALTARSATSEEASLRSTEAASILKFIDRARTIEPKGQVVLAQKPQAGETLLEDGDIVRIPAESNLVLVSGEVIVPSALVWQPRASVQDYIAQAGGFTQGADRARLLVLQQDGSVVLDTSAPLRAGDEVLVLPKIETKSIEITRGITQILYQIAIAAKVALDL